MAQSDENILNHLIQMRSQLTAIQTTLDGEIKNKLMNLSEEVSKHVADDEKLHEKADERIRKLEDGQKRIKWIAVTVGTIMAAVWRVASALMQGHDFFRH